MNERFKGSISLVNDEIGETARRETGTIERTVFNKRNKKFDKSKGLYMVVTPNRSFLVSEKNEILANLEEDEKTYEVMYVEYIGYYVGKTDVICVTKGNVREFQTVNDANSMFVFMQNANAKYAWRLMPINSLERIYKKFKEKGLIMANDVFKREALFREAVYKHMCSST